MYLLAMNWKENIRLRTSDWIKVNDIYDLQHFEFPLKGNIPKCNFFSKTHGSFNKAQIQCHYIMIF